MKCRKTMTKLVAPAALLLMLAFSSAVVGQDEGYDPYGSNSWGNFNNCGPDDNTSGSNSWGNFNNASPDASLGGGLAILSVAGFGYACAKRRKAKRQGLHSKC